MTDYLNLSRKILLRGCGAFGYDDEWYFNGNYETNISINQINNKFPYYIHIYKIHKKYYSYDINLNYLKTYRLKIENKFCITLKECKINIVKEILNFENNCKDEIKKWWKKTLKFSNLRPVVKKIGNDYEYVITSLTDSLIGYNLNKYNQIGSYLIYNNDQSIREIQISSFRCESYFKFEDLRELIKFKMVIFPFTKLLSTGK
jgi:hypothetical protein